MKPIKGHGKKFCTRLLTLSLFHSHGLYFKDYKPDCALSHGLESFWCAQENVFRELQNVSGVHKV